MAPIDGVGLAINGLTPSNFNFFTTFGFSNFKPSNTRQWRKVLANVRSGTGPAKLACVGDSTTAGQGANTGTNGLTGACLLSYPTLLAIALNKIIPAQESSIWGDKNQGAANYNVFDPRLVINSSWAANQTDSVGVGMWKNSADTNALTFTPVQSFDTIDVYDYTNTGFGTFTIDVDGGAPLATVAAGTAGIRKTTVTCAAGTHAINIKRTGVGTNTFIIGIDAYLSTAPAIHVWNWGNPGAKAANLATVTNLWSYANAIAAIVPDMVLINAGINDESVPTDLTAYTASIQTIIKSSLAGGGNVVIMVPTPVSAGSATLANQAALRQTLIAIAANNDLPLIDHSLRLESYLINNGLGQQYDGLHLNKLGYGVVAGSICNSLLFLGA